LTEGAVKADVAGALSGLSTVGCAGLAWKPALAILQQLGAQTVRLAFDADALDKAQVARALAAAAEGLAAAGLAVEMERWDPAAGKGIDDLLAAGGSTEVLTGDTALAAVREALAAATAGEEPAEPDPLERLDAVLAEGGSQALYRSKELLQALARLAESDPAEWSARRAQLHRQGVRLRDLDAALAEPRQALRTERPPQAAAGEYRIVGGRIVHVRPTQSGPVEVPLCNFAARIVEQVTVDDGAERSIRLAVEGALADGTPLPRIEMQAEDYAGMEWVVPGWGTRAVVYACRGTADHLRCAVQLLSGDVPQRTVYGHLGWRQRGERWAYLHAAGAIGADGPVADIEVSPPDALAGYALPAPPEGEDLRRALRASLGMLELGPDRVVYPLLAAAYRAVLGGSDFAEHLCGPSGVFKSELAALSQQHYGPGLDARHLPGSWSSTGNALEGLAFAAKDALLTVDDFAPTGGAADVARLHREAERLLRAQGNAAGRLRMRADSTLRPARPPRGLVLSTGEDVMRGQSLRARLFAVEVAPGDVDVEVLTACQRDGAAGLYAQALAGYVRWLAPQYGDVRGRLAAERAELRSLATGAGQHARTPGIVADLALGLRYLLDYATATAAIDEGEQTALWEHGWAALCEAAAAQAEHVQAAEPTAMFLRLLAAALASGRAHVASPDGDAPVDAGAWGWRRVAYVTRDGPGHRWEPVGRRVGWVEGGELYLEPEASHAAAQEMARDQGEALSVPPRTLHRRLKERGLLASWDTRRQRNTVRRTLEGVRDRDVLHLRADALFPPGGEPSEPSAEDRPNDATTVAADGLADGSEGFARQPSAGPSAGPSGITGENGVCGRFGQSDTGREDLARNFPPERKRGRL
jgi:hypothetical protein